MARSSEGSGAHPRNVTSSEGPRSLVAVRQPPLASLVELRESSGRDDDRRNGSPTRTKPLEGLPHVDALTARGLGASAARLLDALASPEPADAQDDPEEGSERSFFLEVGIEVIVDGTLILRAGDCATTDEWTQWKDLLTTGQRPWNGHDPFTTAALEDGHVRFFDEYDASAPSATVSTERYERMVE